MNDKWEGIERRKVTTNAGHDLLTRIDANLSNHIKLVETHIEDDKIEFGKINNKLEWQQKLIYGGVGIVAFVEFMTRVSK